MSIVLMVSALGVLLYAGVLWNRYLDTLPRTPDAAAGRVHPQNIHGIVVFQTQAEELRLDVAENIAGGVFLLGMFVGALEEGRWRRIAGKNVTQMSKGWQPR